MKKTLAVFSLILAFGVASAFGQATATNLLLTATSLASAVKTSSTTTMTLASSTGVVATSTVLWIEDGTGGNGEAVFVNTVGSGGQVGVTRGYNGTQANQHLTGSVVLFGAPAAFVSSDPSGACIAASSYTPTVNILGGSNGLKGGNQWICSTISASWVPGFNNTQRPAGVTTAVTAATTTVPSGPLFHLVGTTTVTTWGVGLGMGGSTSLTEGAPFCVIPDNGTSSQISAGNNIAKATTTVTNQLLCYVFDQTNKKYVPSY